jgi:predicted dehydrogenase
VDQLEAALAAGKHIYCEKPIVATEEDAARVRRALVGWRGVGQMTFHNRFYSAAQKARHLVDKGFLGTPLGFRGVYLHAGNIDPGVTMKWRLRKAAGGGVLRDLGAHLLDLLEFLAGPIASISASPRILHAVRPDGRGGMETVDVEDQICMTARLACGAVGTLEASKIATGAEDDLRLEIEGTRGALRFNVMAPDFLETYSRDDPDTPMGGERGWKKIAVLQRYPAPAVFPSARATSGWLRGHVHCLHNFLSAVAAGRPAEPSLERGLRVQDLIQAAEKAGATGAWQTVRSG